MANKRSNRDEWQKRVDRWRESGLTAKEFAAEMGLNAGTLQFWKYKLKKRRDGSAERRREGAAQMASSLVEIRPVGAGADARFEIELGNGRRVRVPAAFEPAALKTLLAVADASL
jgi:hypothetical protein